jgi:uncharacterized protein DUF4031
VTIFVDRMVVRKVAAVSYFMRSFRYHRGRILFCRMTTDGDIEELHRFARMLRVDYKLFQAKYGDHYIINYRTKLLAKKRGAYVVSRRELSLIMKGRNNT